ncbi:MAG: excisionase, partial [Firmicutes bacterium]|nr:excisionase [Bacillota bacterium]
IVSRPFRSWHDKQIKLVKDFSWIDLDLLNGIEDEYASILAESVTDASELEARHKKLCLALRKRIELFRGLITKKR